MRSPVFVVALGIAATLLGILLWQTGRLPSAGRLDAIYFENETHGFVHLCCPPAFRMYETNDGGKSWHLSNSTEPKFRRGRVFVSPLKGYSVVEGPWPYSEIHVTEDGGKTWRRVFHSNQEGEFLFDDLQAVSETEVWAGWYHSTDSGQTWYQGNVPGGVPFFLNRNTGWSIHDSKVWQTEDGSENWRQIGKLPRLEKDYGQGDVFFVDAKHGWLVTARQEGNVEGGELSSVVLFTEDGGATWETMPVIKGYYLWSIFFLNEKIGWAGGTGGSLLRTADGGKTWAPV